jgi:hypothetical protein
MVISSSGLHLPLSKVYYHAYRGGMYTINHSYHDFYALSFLNNCSGVFFRYMLYPTYDLRMIPPSHVHYNICTKMVTLPSNVYHM